MEKPLKVNTYLILNKKDNVGHSPYSSNKEKYSNLNEKLFLNDFLEYYYNKINIKLILFLMYLYFVIRYWHCLSCF